MRIIVGQAAGSSPRVDRLARSTRDLQNIVYEAFFDMLGVFAEFETNLRKERQMEGIARAKANGVYARSGRPASIDATRVREMKAQGLGATEIARELGIGRASVYRVLEAEEWTKF